MTKGSPTTSRRVQRPTNSWKLRFRKKQVRRRLFRTLPCDQGRRVDSPIVRLRKDYLRGEEKDECDADEMYYDVASFLQHVPEALLAETKYAIVDLIYDLMARLYAELRSFRRRNIYKISSGNVRIRYDAQRRRFETRWDLSVPQNDPREFDLTSMHPIRSYLRAQDTDRVLRTTNPVLREHLWWRFHSMNMLASIMMTLLFKLDLYTIMFSDVRGKLDELYGTFMGFIRVSPEDITIFHSTLARNLHTPQLGDSLRINGYDCTCVAVDDECIICELVAPPQDDTHLLSNPLLGSWVEEIYDYEYTK